MQMTATVYTYTLANEGRGHLSYSIPVQGDKEEMTLYIVIG